MFLVNMIKRTVCNLIANYYENKQHEFMEKLNQKLQSKKYTLSPEIAEEFNHYTYYKMLLRGGHWGLWRRQVRNDKAKK